MQQPQKIEHTSSVKKAIVLNIVNLKQLENRELRQYTWPYISLSIQRVSITTKCLYEEREQLLCSWQASRLLLSLQEFAIRRVDFGCAKEESSWRESVASRRAATDCNILQSATLKLIS